MNDESTEINPSIVLVAYMKIEEPEIINNKSFLHRWNPLFTSSIGSRDENRILTSKNWHSSTFYTIYVVIIAN